MGGGGLGDGRDQGVAWAAAAYAIGGLRGWHPLAQGVPWATAAYAMGSGSPCDRLPWERRSAGDHDRVRV
jgi:hypothetical protein